LIAVSVFTTLTVLLHRYVWARLIRDPAWGAPWGTVLAIAVFSLAALLPLALPAMRYAPRAVNVPLGWIVFTWMGFLFYLFVLTLVSDAGRGIASLLGVLPQEPERRRFLARTIAVGVAGVAGVLGVGGFINVARGFTTRRVRVPLAKLPAGASGYRIVQMSDIHVGPTIGHDFIVSLVREANALSPDLVVITGDLVDGTVEQLREHVAPLAELRAKDGVYFVTGNHEYYSGADEWIAHLATLGIRVLRNERVRIGGDDGFDLAGIDDHSAFGRGHGSDLPRALAGRDERRACVLLAHQPRGIELADALGVDLQLSGHTHGGQMFPWGFAVRLQQPFVAGLHKLARAYIYVSRGTGYWGPPMRLAAPAE